MGYYYYILKLKYLSVRIKVKLFQDIKSSGKETAINKIILLYIYKKKKSNGR